MTGPRQTPWTARLHDSHYKTLLSLGRSCQCARQLRRFSGNESAHYFDWLGTPFEGLLAVVESRFTTGFELSELELAPDSRSVVHRPTRLVYRHLFRKASDAEFFTMEDISTQHQEHTGKLAYLASKWLRTLHDEKPLCVRHDALTSDQAMHLYRALHGVADEHEFGLLVVTPPGISWRSPHPQVYCVSGIPLSSGPDDWKGDDALWDKVLEPFWTGSSPRPVATSTSAALARLQGKPARPVVLFQVPNQVGLGHMNRMACVAKAMRELNQRLRVLFVVEGSSHGFLEGFKLPYLDLPSSQTMHKEGSWVPFAKEEKQALATAASAGILDSVQPALIVYDCFPNLSFAKAAADRAIPSVLCIRNVKDYPLYMEQQRVKIVLDSCICILVPHTAEESTLPEPLFSRAVYIGPIVRPLPDDPIPVQVRLNLPGKRIIVISAGGGGHRDTAAFLKLSLEAFDHLQSRFSDLAAVLIPGPLFTEWERLPMIANVRILPFDPDFLETCATADAVVAQAGYNSAQELALLGTPAILVPASRGFDDQFGRAEKMAAASPHIATLRELDSAALSAALEDVLVSPPPRVRGEAPEGAYLAALHLISMIEGV